MSNLLIRRISVINELRDGGHHPSGPSPALQSTLQPLVYLAFTVKE